MISYEEALKTVVDAATAVGAERIPLNEATGRVLAAPVRADRDLPPFPRSERDGWAVRSADFGGGEATLAWDRRVIFAGDDPGPYLAPGSTVRIMTGASLPEGADAVVMVERSREAEGSVALREPKVGPGLHVHRRGSDAVAGEEVVPAGVILTPARGAVAASVGVADPAVRRRVRVSVISSGDELVPFDADPGPTRIRECNGPFLGSVIQGLPWLELHSWWIVADDPSALEQAIHRVLADSDAVVLSGGVSMGDKDLVPAALEASGVRRLLHKVAIRPGKPFWLGAAERDKLVFGLPGNPVSLQVTFREFVLPGLRRMAGMTDVHSPALRVPAGSAIEKTLDLRQFVPARLAPADGHGTVASPVENRGSGDFVSASRADGVIVLPEGPARIVPGDLVTFHPWGIA